MTKIKKETSSLKSKENEIISLNTRIRQAAHDLNNILTSSNNSIAAIKQLIKPKDKIQKYLTNIETNSIRATELIEELLVSEGIGERIKRRININDLINDVIRTLRGSLGDNVDLNVSVIKNLYKVNGFYSDLYRALLNLALNAVESIEGNGKITIKARNVSSRKKEPSIVISIKDTGCGISEESLKSIFTEGYSTKQKKVVSGLGLSIVKNIIEIHDGEISIKSKVDKGTEFIITLPAVKSLKKKTNKEKIKKILIAEDEAPILESICYLLESYDYETVCAANGELAIQQFDENDDIDLMIIDKFMPIVDGLEVVKNIRKKNKAIPIILTTGLQEADEKKFKKLGINKIIKKPYDFDLMIELIRNATF
ncbi:MAG: hybrid sensor histidine kinase/response regulator [Chlorobi bacterium]|nr:hybrid sensor histidine kinase/response regulator [Chlorobiota bacterium]